VGKTGERGKKVFGRTKMPPVSGGEIPMGEGWKVLGGKGKVPERFLKKKFEEGKGASGSIIGRGWMGGWFDF